MLGPTPESVKRMQEIYRQTEMMVMRLTLSVDKRYIEVSLMSVQWPYLTAPKK